NRISALWHNLKRGLDAKGIIDIHEAFTKISALGCLHVMSHDGTSLLAIWPEPNKRDGFFLAAPQRQSHHRINELFNGSVYGPTGKRTAIPSAQRKPLQVLSHCNRHQRARYVVAHTNEGTLGPVTSVSREGIDIFFPPEGFDNVGQVEGQG